MSDLLQWKVGELRITRLQELQAPGMRFIVPETTIENLSTIPWITPFLDDQGDAVGSVHSLIIETSDRCLIVDTCVGNDKERRMRNWSHRQGPFLEQLMSAGFAPERFDTVICTHLHTDHVGWNTKLENDKWVPTFPNARYIVARPEWEHWSASDDHWTQIVMSDSVQPIFDAGVVDLVETNYQIDAAIQLEATPGHTPGHVSVRLESQGETAVITGDLVHHPSQFARPDWGSSADVNAEQADDTRKAFMERYVNTTTLIIGTHFAGPTAGRLVRDGCAYRLDVT